MLTLTSEHTYSEYHFITKFQTKISLSDQKFEKQEEELIYFKGKQQMEPNKSSSEHIESEMPTLVSETSSSGYHLDTKPQTNFHKYDQIFEQPEE